MPSLKGTRTEQNLKDAFAGESRANRRYLCLARNADVSSRTTCEIAGGDVVLGSLPLFHSFGQTVAMNASLRVGACLAVSEAP